MRSENTCFNSKAADLLAKNSVANPRFHVRTAIGAIKSVWQKKATSNQTKIKIYIDPSIPDVLPIDPLIVQHSLNNLASNAVKHTKNGNIQIIVSRVDALESDSDDHTFLAFSIRDTGIGIAPARLETVFQRNCDLNSSRHNSYGVVDTSLAMSRDLISSIGGKIFIKSILGKGSLFSVLIPIAKKSLQINFAKPQINNTRTCQFSDLNILVVDDYNLNQVTIKTLLHDHVGKIYSAANGNDALEILYSCPIDIVLMDIHMPVMDGIEATLKIRESGQSWAGVRIVAMTADPQYHQAQLYRKIGMDGTLPKPFCKRDILQVMENYTAPYKKTAAK